MKLTPLDTVMKYMDIFYSDEDLSQLNNLFAEDMIVQGPSYQFETAKQYIDSLVTSPPIDCRYEMIESFEKGSIVCLVYLFKKGDLSSNMSQLFEVVNGKITRILLVFNTRDFG